MREDRTEESSDSLTPPVHPTTQSMLAEAEFNSGSVVAVFTPEVRELLSTWMRREAHLLQFRYLELLQAGAPDETAQFLAQDDMGLQLAVAMAEHVG